MLLWPVEVFTVIPVAIALGLGYMYGFYRGAANENRYLAQFAEALAKDEAALGSCKER